jgi:GNAT superfamily N-acetyltransferase
VLIRPARPTDHARLALIWHESARGMDGAGDDLPPVEALALRIAREKSWHILVAVENDTIVGFTAIIPDRCILDQLFITPPRQGFGFGTALLAAAIDAMPAGFSLRTAHANRRAQLYYERHGLRLLGDDRHPVTSLPVHYYAWTPRDHDAPDRSVRIYLLRHGETEWNAAGRFQGALDSALTQRGVLQARASGRRLASLIARADAVHASPLGRTRETCRHVTAFGIYPDVEWECRLREVSLGSWDGLTDIDIEQGWPGRLDGLPFRLVFPFARRGKL